MRDGWECVIGLEIHTQLNTKSKIFSGSSTAFGSEANTQASLVDLGFPGVLPVVNREVFRKAVAFGLAVGSKINRKSVFDRKNYFYPDLPKGYQITQLAEPIVEGGSVDITLESGETGTIRITRAHLEEDAGKSLHEDYHGQSGIDLNRAGTPLIEIVSEPDLRSTEAAVAYARKIHSLVTWLDVSDGDMSQGSFRCDANVSVRPAGEKALGTRTEIKNINSFRFLERAIDYEIERQIDAIEAGERIRQETRLYDPDRDETRPMRSKETSMDYRYFPEPDLLPVVLEQQFIDDVASSMPEMPAEKIERFVREFELSQADAEILASSRKLADYFEIVATQSAQSRSAANWVRVELLARLNRAELDIGESPVSAPALAAIVKRIEDNTISGKTAKQVFDALWEGEATDVDQYIEDKGLKQVSDTSSIEPVVDQVIRNNPSQVEQYRGGKTKLLGFFVGQVMKETGGTANPQQVNEIIRARLDAE